VSAAQHTPGPHWYVDYGAQRLWFEDEFTARTYLLLMRAAFHLQPGIDLFLGRDVLPERIARATGSAA
jgi:hypothetical protein